MPCPYPKIINLPIFLDRRCNYHPINCRETALPSPNFLLLWETEMSKFKLFDAVNLIEAVALADGEIAPPETTGIIVEVFKNGEAYLVELFGGWVKAEVGGNFVPATQDESGAFMETIGVETVYPHQLQLVKSAGEMMGVRSHLLSILDNFSDELVAEVRDFAEFLEQKQAKSLNSAVETASTQAKPACAG